jgi:hypothetical protein
MSQLTGRTATSACGARSPGVAEVKRRGVDAGVTDGGGAADAGAPPEPVDPSITCYADTECIAGREGRCNTTCGDENFRGGACLRKQACSYTACAQDSECQGKDVCECNDRFGHRCVPSTCRTNADCAAGFPCTRASDGYHCRTPADECVVASDCATTPGGSAYARTCDYLKASQRWVCVDVPPPAP